MPIKSKPCFGNKSASIRSLLPTNSILLSLSSLISWFANEIAVNSFAKESRLHDETGQLSNDEYSQILTMLDAYSQQHEIDICINVVNDTDGYSIDDYANDKFDQYQYGYDDNYSCILLTIDMGSRQYW